LKVSEDEVEISAGKIYQMILKPIILVDPSTAKAVFDIKTRTLTVQINKLKVFLKDFTSISHDLLENCKERGRGY